MGNKVPKKKGIKSVKKNKQIKKNIKAYYLIGILITGLILISIIILLKTKTEIDLGNKTNITRENIQNNETKSTTKTADNNQTEEDNIPKDSYIKKSDNYKGYKEEPVNNESKLLDTDGFKLNGEIITLNHWKRGICSDNSSSYEDSCEGSILDEYYLEDNVCKLNTFDCNNFLEFYKEGTQIGCYKGECVLKETGKNYSYKGEVIDNNQKIYWDECINNDLLKEYFLSDSFSTVFKEISCSEKYGLDYYCSEGACIKSADKNLALDSDNGEDILIKGTCESVINGNNTDYCTDSKRLVEYFVDLEDNSKCSSKTIDCPGNCRFGKCNAEDFDFGKNYTTQSFCGGIKINYDSCNCLNDGNPCYSLKEWFTSENTCDYEIVDCRTVLGNEQAKCYNGYCTIQRI